MEAKTMTVLSRSTSDFRCSLPVDLMYACVTLTNITSISLPSLVQKIWEREN